MAQAPRGEIALFLQDQIDAERKRAEVAETNLAQAQQTNQALIQEFLDATAEESPGKIRRNIRGRIPRSLEILDTLMETGKEPTRASIAKFFITAGLSEGTSPADAGSETRKMLEELMS